MIVLNNIIIPNCLDLWTILRRSKIRIWLSIKSILFCFGNKLFVHNSSVAISVWFGMWWAVSRILNSFKILTGLNNNGFKRSCSPHTKPDSDCNRRVLFEKLIVKANWNRLYCLDLRELRLDCWLRPHRLETSISLRLLINETLVNTKYTQKREKNDIILDMNISKFMSFKSIKLGRY